MEQIVSHLKKSVDILLVTHTNPDGDAIGSLLSMGLAMTELGKRVTLYCQSPIPAVYKFLPFVNRIKRTIKHAADCDTVVVLDCGDLERIGESASMAGQIPVMINIDHHITNTGFGDFQLVDTSACATSEIIYRIINELDVRVDKNMAVAIYTGILTDTGSFRTSNTNLAAFTICEEMIKIGADPYKVAQHVYGTYSLGRIMLLNRALDSIEISRNGKLSIMTLTQEMLTQTNTQPEDADGLINYARRIEDVKVAALIFEQENLSRDSKNINRFHVSLRSDDDVDVASIAASFGGGGHFNASGFNIDTVLPDVKTTLFRLAETL